MHDTATPHERIPQASGDRGLPDRLLRKPAVRQLLGDLPSSTFDDWVARGDFPRPVKIGRRAVAWSEREVQAWIEARKAARAG